MHSKNPFETSSNTHTRCHRHKYRPTHTYRHTHTNTHTARYIHMELTYTKVHNCGIKCGEYRIFYPYLFVFQLIQQSKYINRHTNRNKHAHTVVKFNEICQNVKRVCNFVYSTNKQYVFGVWSNDFLSNVVSVINIYTNNLCMLSAHCYCCSLQFCFDWVTLMLKWHQINRSCEVFGF